MLVRSAARLRPTYKPQHPVAGTRSSAALRSTAELPARCRVSECRGRRPLSPLGNMARELQVKDDYQRCLMRIKLLITLLALSAGAAQAGRQRLLRRRRRQRQTKLEDIGDSTLPRHRRHRLESSSRASGRSTVSRSRPTTWTSAANRSYFGAIASVHADAKAFAAYAVGFLPCRSPSWTSTERRGLRAGTATDTNRLAATSFALDDNGTEFAWGAGAQVQLRQPRRTAGVRELRRRKHRRRSSSTRSA